MLDEATLKKRTPPTFQWDKEASKQSQSGVPSCPLALSCQPLTVMRVEFSTSIAPEKFLLMVPADPPTPGPCGFAPPPSRIRFEEFSTRTPTELFCSDV